MNWRLGFWRIDPDGGGLFGWDGLGFDEAVGVGLEGVVEGLLTFGVNLAGLSEMDLVWGHEADAVMVVVPVVPIEEGSAEGLGVLDGAELFGELGLIFTRFEEAFREGVVVGGVGPAVGFRDAEIGEEEGGGFGFHGGSAIGVEGELAGRNGVAFDRLEE